MKVLGFDTSGPWIAVALLDAEALTTRVEEMERGQAERLIPLLEEVLGRPGWHSLDALAVCTGPGNFTGLRIGISAARGLAMGLGVPAVGVSTFEAVAAQHRGAVQVAVRCPGNAVYLGDPAQPEIARVVPARSPDAARALPAEDTPLAARAEGLVRIAAHRADGSAPAPAPLYIRAANAAPPRDDGLRLL